MKVGILGAGTVGKTLAAAFTTTGHDVRLGGRSEFAAAAAHGELLVLAVPGNAAEEMLRQMGAAAFAGKIVIDAQNPLTADPPEHGVFKVFTGPNDSLGERIQKLLPGAGVVKAFNSVGSGLMFRPNLAGGPPTMFYCGNDDLAKAQVAEVIRSFGWQPYDCGSIVAARVLEPLCGLWCLPGVLRGDWKHAFKVIS